MTRLKRLIPALLCASLSIGSLRAAEWTADQLRLSAPYLQLGYFDQARRNQSVEGNPLSIGGVRYNANSIGLHAEGEFVLKLECAVPKTRAAVKALTLEQDVNVADCDCRGAGRQFEINFPAVSSLPCRIGPHLGS